MIRIKVAKTTDPNWEAYRGWLKDHPETLELGTAERLALYVADSEEEKVR